MQELMQLLLPRHCVWLLRTGASGKLKKKKKKKKSHMDTITFNAQIGELALDHQTKAKIPGGNA